MNILELFNKILENNIDLDLIGDISYDDDDYIVWEYDGLGKCDDNMEEHLLDVYETDKEILEDYLVDLELEDYFFIHEPNFDESFTYFHITED